MPPFLIVFQHFFHLAHDPRHHQVEHIVEHTGHKQRGDGGFGGGHLLGQGEHLRVGQHKGQGGVLYQSDDLVGHRGQDLLAHLGKDDLAEGLDPVVAQHPGRLPLSPGNALDSRPEDFREIGGVVDGEAHNGGGDPPSGVEPDAKEIIGPVKPDDQLEHQGRAPENGDQKLDD